MQVKRISKDRLVFETAKAISAILEKEQDKDVLLMLAGGSAFEVYNAILPQWLSNHVTIAMTDDRFSREMDINNTHLLQATDFYNESIHADTYFISTEVWNEQTPEELAKRFECGLRKWREEFPKGVVVAIFGMGEDGHTAGMIPGNGKSDGKEKTFLELFEKNEKWVVGYSTPNNEHHDRVTITMPFIRKHVDHAVAFISGEKKRPALERLLAEKGGLAETPARILHELKNVDIFTDIIQKYGIKKSFDEENATEQDERCAGGSAGKDFRND
jgi:6-phosphogluconolactonase/glucosamine-6-phosphate isomerase/deaminase